MKKGKIPVDVAEGIPATLDKYGEFLIGVGKIEEKTGPLTKLMEKFSGADIEKLLEEMNREDPELAVKYAHLMMKALILFPVLENPSKLPADEKIRVGGEIKEISRLMRELLE